ncbi:MAG TPA: proton-conducting transporter membrane subunit, partial [Gemmatimonadaceae bacterium]|nr:proton-conducting transporter membrane subunit [Gemmatimonadaceae bacterium]
MRDFLNSIGYMGWVLPALLAIPVVGAALVWATPTPRRRGLPVGTDEVAAGIASGPRWVAFWVLLIEFVVSLGLWWAFDPSTSQWQAVFDRSWIPGWGVRFTIGIDGIALMMILLTTFIMVLAVVGSWTGIRARSHGYYSLMLLLTAGMLGVFMSLDLFLFYVMWEVMLVPMYFIVGIWGGERRVYASVKFFIYTMVGSLLMLVAI